MPHPPQKRSPFSHRRRLSIVAVFLLLKFKFATGGAEVSAVASVGVSASQRCPSDTRTHPLHPGRDLLFN